MIWVALWLAFCVGFTANGAAVAFMCGFRGRWTQLGCFVFVLVWAALFLPATGVLS